MDKKYVLHIYIAGIAPDTQSKIIELKDILTAQLGDTYSLKVIDVLEKPHLAEEDHVLATPTIIRQEPSPLKKVILNLSNKDVSPEDLDILLKD